MCHVVIHPCCHVNKAVLAHPHPSSRSMLHVRWQHAASAYSLIRLKEKTAPAVHLPSSCTFTASVTVLFQSSCTCMSLIPYPCHIRCCHNVSMVMSCWWHFVQHCCVLIISACCQMIRLWDIFSICPVKREVQIKLFRWDVECYITFTEMWTLTLHSITFVRWGKTN